MLCAQEPPSLRESINDVRILWVLSIPPPPPHQLFFFIKGYVTFDIQIITLNKAGAVELGAQGAHLRTQCLSHK